MHIHKSDPKHHRFPLKLLNKIPQWYYHYNYVLTVKYFPCQLLPGNTVFAKEKKACWHHNTNLTQI